MEPQQNRGISRVLEKLRNSIRSGEYYEAHQMYRTLYFRYLGQKKYNDLKNMLYEGCLLLLDADQKGSGADLALLLVEVLNQSEDKECAIWTPKLSTIFLKIGRNNTTERDAFLVQVFKWTSQNSSQGNAPFHQSIAKIYWEELNYSQARYHYVHSQDGKACAKLLIEFQMVEGYKNEVDLFIAQAVLQFLCLRNQITASQTFNTYTEQHPKIKKTGPPFLLPLLNFIWFLLQAVETKKLQTFAILCEQYQKSLQRDPCYVQYLDKIGQIFFGIRPPQEKRSGGIFGSFLDSFIGSLDEESDDDLAQGQQKPSTSRQPIENSDLD
ncbi:hypothetical protein ABEB36_009778 [Hypothenemus hampei]|uniref:Golgi to ER traffic protein 4 homolog n=1 Tax=Hypothenemus hampei TaxID=57062 RepID=A0ABD1ELI6_HYPHA